jgi:hypothetical protein
MDPEISETHFDKRAEEEGRGVVLRDSEAI